MSAGRSPVFDEIATGFDPRTLAELNELALTLGDAADVLAALGREGDAS